jgi:hypothetical protein
VRARHHAEEAKREKARQEQIERERAEQVRDVVPGTCHCADVECVDRKPKHSCAISKRPTSVRAATATARRRPSTRRPHARVLTTSAVATMADDVMTIADAMTLCVVMTIAEIARWEEVAVAAARLVRDAMTDRDETIAAAVVLGAIAAAVVRLAIAVAHATIVVVAVAVEAVRGARVVTIARRRVVVGVVRGATDLVVMTRRAHSIATVLDVTMAHDAMMHQTLLVCNKMTFVDVSTAKALKLSSHANESTSTLARLY